MGEISDMMLSGEMCEACGEFLPGDAPGYPQYCQGCSPGAPSYHKIVQLTGTEFPCGLCERKFSTKRAAKQHKKDAHHGLV